MRKLLVLLASLFAFSAMLFAQTSSSPILPSTEVFAGYTFMNSGLQNYGFDQENLNGETLQLSVYLHNNIGVTGEVTRTYGSNVAESGENVSRYTYLFGPTYSLRTSSVATPFVHVLFGADHERLSISYLGDESNNSFAAAFGGGLDVRAADHLALRLAQIDYIYTNHSGGEHTFRYSGGVVLRF